MAMKDGFEWNKADPLAQCEDQGESLKANQALRDYAHLGMGRSLVKLCAKYQNRGATAPLPPTTQLSALKTWCARQAWVDRVAAWTDLQHVVDEEQWKTRRAEQREQDWQDANALEDFFAKILDLGPTFLHEKFKEGKATVVDRYGNVISRGEPSVRTVALGTADMVKVRKLALELAKRATGTSLERALDDLQGIGKVLVLPDNGRGDRQLDEPESG